MTFGLFVIEEVSSRPVLEEKALRIVSRYWEVSGVSFAERRYGSKQRLLADPFGLL